MDFDLDRMGWRQFEHLTQTLSMRELGNGVQIFGDGADGGREATFQGAVDFPRGAGELWNGYGVIQAKHHSFPSDSDQKSADLLIADIKLELQKFVKNELGKAKRNPKPDYFLIATNMRLAPGEGKGLDRVEAELKLWREKLSLKGTYVWHYANICRMLEEHESVRRAFAGFITPGDVLSELIEYFGVSTAAIGTQLRVHAAQQIRNEQWVDLGDSGGQGDEQLALNRVGIDLPATKQSVMESDDGDVQSDVRVLKHVLARGDGNLRADFEAPEGTGIVLIGGPGQGKSTITQLICQAYRVALLADAAPHNLTPYVRALVDNSRDHFADMGISLPINRRWPVNVKLARFGEAVASDPEITLLKFIAAGIKVDGETLMTNQLTKWTADWPWLLVLDGLDEVAATETRKRVVDRIAEFVTEIRMKNRDVLVVATTRPQGYHGEFAEFEPEQLQLRELNTDESLDYASHLVAIRQTDNAEKGGDVMNRLAEAASREVTSRLMKTPLQVTIMTILLESISRVPTTKFALFDAYYRTIYAREIGRAGQLGVLLETHREHIDFVHEQVGLRLQAGAETVGEANAALSDEDLEGLFRERLEHAGYEEADVERLTKDLLRAAKNRVVLLVAKRPDYVAFEVKSLQEYMAARAMAGGSDLEILDRVEALAPSAFWRHTLLLLIAQVFTIERLRDALLGRIRQLDQNRRIGSFLGDGEQLALDLLEDDIAFSSPAIRRALLQHALGMLGRWPRPELAKLADVVKPFVDSGNNRDSMLAKKLIRESFSSRSRARISALVVLRLWLGKPGFAGAFANLELATDSNWKPVQPADTNGEVLLYSVGSVLSELATTEGLSADQLLKWNQLTLLLSARPSTRAVSDAEMGQLARQRVKLSEVLEMEPLVSDSDIIAKLMDAVDALDVEDAAVASWLQQAVAILDEKAPVGSDARIAAVIR